MEFTNLDTRARDDSGYAVDLLHPETGETIRDEKGAAKVIIYGQASRTAQAKVAEMLRAKMTSDDTDQSSAIETMEAAHQATIDAALPFIAGFENVQRDGRALTGSDEDVRWFLDLSFPRMSEVDGVYSLVNKPFASQVLEAVKKRADALGNG